MGPEMIALAPYIAAAGTAATTAATAYASAQQGKAEQKVAAAQQAWADRQADEEMAAGQRAAAEEQRKAKFAQSRLMSIAGASGSGVSDPTVMKLWGDIDSEGRVNAGTQQAMAQQRADGVNYQAALDRWRADSNARIGKIGAIGTILGGAADTYGNFSKSRMALRYGGGGSSSNRTGYGS